jgi:hypothetical protein
LHKEVISTLRYKRPFGLALDKILLANALSVAWKRHQLGECRLPRSCERRSSEPGTEPNEVHGCRRQHMLQMDLGQSDIPGAPQVEGADTLRIRSLDAGALLILL